MGLSRCGSVQALGTPYGPLIRPYQNCKLPLLFLFDTWIPPIYMDMPSHGAVPLLRGLWS